MRRGGEKNVAEVKPELCCDTFIDLGVVLAGLKEPPAPAGSLDKCASTALHVEKRAEFLALSSGSTGEQAVSQDSSHWHLAGKRYRIGLVALWRPRCEYC